MHVVKNVSLLDRIFSVSASTLWQLSFISYFSIFLLLSFPFAERLPFCAMIYLENISKCAQGTAHNEKTIVRLHYASFLSNIPWVQRWSVTRLLARVLAGSPHLVLAPIDGLVATPGSSSLTGRVFWLRCFFFFLLQFVKTLSAPFHGSPSRAGPNCPITSGQISVCVRRVQKKNGKVVFENNCVVICPDGAEEHDRQ